jgi:hypothetical protein
MATLTASPSGRERVTTEAAGYARDNGSHEGWEVTTDGQNSSR